MTATTIRTTTPGPRTARRRCATRRRVLPSRRARPAHRVAGQKLASGIFLSAPPETRPASRTLTLGTHQENLLCSYDFASGCAVAPNTADYSKYRIPTTPLLDLIPWGTDGKSSKIRIVNDDPVERARLEAILEKLRNLRSPTGRLTQAALLLRKLERSGLAFLVRISGKFGIDRRELRSHGGTGPEDHNGNRGDDINRAVSRGELVGSRIEFDADPIAADEVAALAHELVHAIQYLTGQARGTLDQEDIEYEATRIGNEAFVAIGDQTNTTGTYKGSEVPGWNRYIPWIMTPGKSY